LFDFKGDLYGETLDVAFVSYLREEKKFDTIESLIAQMNEDSGNARAALAAAPDAFPKLGDIG
jgi:riboflavin kinase/FMN adenylyltransferase